MEDYLVTIEKFFLSLKESGLSLSATDYDLIQQWENRGIPTNVICRGIETGFIEFDRSNSKQPSRISLSYFKVFIEEEIERGWNQKPDKWLIATVAGIGDMFSSIKKERSRPNYAPVLNAGYVMAANEYLKKPLKVF